ncbi:symmetrical bis(5'-nucleosyl)-tetraphosphatase [Ramlibacter algicola]|uniref:bis(5'-nucleosyl)-tetraphosphatase (symmetrical) n=1 Tax=Ramlibacter algicola TaxID=2795217 RepID=A0A934UR00_9BURK|nr:symmetrical bis(5'-nucleosyl)-tetraphosphatase [Ramlibacter algicola]MBK0392168.1 symmetrical bis(5'-nucleosyl)-tetraphosphatase [Ramlibacter algicola]
MALYLIGDVQGCDEPLARLLRHVDFSPSRDHLYLLGDLVNRGPASAQVLRRLMALDGSAQCLLGNHDLSLLAISQGVRAARPGDTIDSVLGAPDRDALLHWLRHQRMALHAHGVLMLHGGVLPQWDVAQVLSLAGEVESALRSPGHADFFREMYGNLPDAWSDDLQGADRLRVIVNALTRLRFCTPGGVMHLKASGRLDEAPPSTLAWFDVPGRRTAGAPVAFGHWSQLGLLLRDDLIALDTGCVWGGCLSALRFDPVTGSREVVQVKCPQAQEPGGD